MTTSDDLLQRVKALKLYGIESHFDTAKQTEWLEPLLNWEESERSRRSLERRLHAARLGRFKLLAEFDWSWPKQCDRQAIEACMALGFIE
jgi:DNA replication protein DnaC